MADWNCFTSTSSAPVQSWSTPEGAVEFLRRQLEDHQLYSKEVLVSALAELRARGKVELRYDLPGGGELHLRAVRQ